MQKPIAIGADHAGFAYKERIAEHLRGRGIEVTDCGTDSSASTDYPIYARRVAEEVASGRSDIGMLVCGSGIGVAITANRVRGVRAANCLTVEMAETARQHNDANILCLGERLVDWERARAIVDTFLATPPSTDERHRRRVAEIDPVS